MSAVDDVAAAAATDASQLPLSFFYSEYQKLYTVDAFTLSHIFRQFNFRIYIDEVNIFSAFSFYVHLTRADGKKVDDEKQKKKKRGKALTQAEWQELFANL